MSTDLLIEGVQTAPDKYEVVARPEFGKSARFRVERGQYQAGYSRRYGFLVRIGDGTGWITSHSSFERAIASANFRARRYVRAYAKPRTLAGKG
jgi:hypothetical protein